ALRLKARGTTRRSTVRSTRALLSFAVAAGLAVHATTAVADPDRPSPDSSDETAEAFLADLIGEVSSAEGAVASMENELGGLRESVNKARVDVDRSQREAQEAQDSVTDARGRLDTSQTDVEDAQGELDEIARSAYTQGGDAAPIALAAGDDIAADTLDRSTYIRMASEKQQSEIDRLDLIRTQTANEESSLRESRDEADGLVTAARDAHTAAEQAYTDAQSAISEKSGELEGLRDELSTSEARLAAAKRAVDTVSSNAGASSFDKRRAAEAAADRAEFKTEDLGPETPEAEAPETDAPTEEAPAEAPVAQDLSEAPQETAEVPAEGEATTEAEVPAEGEATTEAEVPAESEAATEGEAPVEGETAAEGEVQPEGEAQPEGDEALPEEPSADGSAELSEVPSSFDGSSEGDARRQAAIDGLVGAAGAAAFAGINSHIEGNPDGAGEAAVNAARESASGAYGNLPEETAENPDTPEAPDPSSEGGSVPSAPGGSSPAAPDSSGSREEQIERVIDRGMEQLGVTYAWGGGNADGPTLGVRDGGVADTHGDYAKEGFDCSGLMVYAFAAVGVELEKYSGYQYTSGNQVPVGDAERGDMLFWGPGGSQHVALYLGDGTMLEAPNSGDVVKVSEVRWDGIEPMAVRMIE
ncbi:MAG: DIP1281 family NlpC/P60 protein, partial [Mycobacteriaceae bacterium]